MSEYEQPERIIWETYAESWKVPADEKKARYVDSLAPDCVYTDPLTQAQGWDELLAYMVEFHQQVPGGHFVTKRFEVHHDVSLAHWDMVAGDGSVVGEGASYGRYGDDGKLVAMTGFFATAAE